MTARRRLDRVELDLEQATARRNMDEVTVQEPLTTDELQAVIEQRRQHPAAVEEWNQGGPPALGSYSTEELQEIVDFELTHPLGDEHR